MDDNFISWTAPHSQSYFQDHGLTIADYRKDLLCELATAVHCCKLSVDPHFSSIDAAVMLRDKPRSLVISDAS